MTRGTFRLRGLVAAATLACLLCAASLALAADGDLDPGFGSDGQARLTMPDLFQPARLAGSPIAAQDAQGRTVVAQRVDGIEVKQAVIVWRLTSAGQVDPAFNGGEPLWLRTDAGVVEAVRVVDGQILIVVSHAQGTAFALFRLADDGTPVATAPADDPFGDLEALELGDDARPDETCQTVSADIAASGRIDAFFDCGDGFGTDRTFGADGTVLGLEFVGDTEHGGGDIVDAHANESGDVRVLVRHDGDGDNDTFDLYAHGQPIAAHAGAADALAVAADGSAVVAGGSSQGWRVLRFDAAGALVGDFGSGGEQVLTDARLAAVQDAVRYVTLGTDGRIALVGWASDSLSQAVALLGADGAPVTGWGPNGVRLLTDAAPFILYAAGPALFQADGRLVVPVGVDRASARAARGAVSPYPYDLVFRFGGGAPVQQTPPPPTVPQQEQQTTTPAMPAAIQPPAAPVTTTARSQTRPRTLRTCRSRRSFTIRLRPKSRELKRAVVRVAGKRVKVRHRKGRLVATVNLKKMRQATFTVRVVATDAAGHKHRETRRYRTCRFGKNGPKVKGGSTIITVGR